MPNFSGIWTVTQQMQARGQSIWPDPPPTTIGQAFGGGFWAGQISTAGNSIADYNLVIGPLASAESTLQWKTTNTSTAGTSSVIDGPTNSANMNNASHPAAQFCEGLTVGGFTDWYMPAINELEVCYYNLKPSTTANSTGSGTNPNAVPARASNYTSGDPAQTSAANFKTGTGAEAYAITAPLSYALGGYWSSTQGGANYGRGMGFNSGIYQSANNFSYKNTSLRVRAIRRVAV